MDERRRCLTGVSVTRGVHRSAPQRLPLIKWFRMPKLPQLHGLVIDNARSAYDNACRVVAPRDLFGFSCTPMTVRPRSLTLSGSWKTTGRVEKMKSSESS